MSLRDVLRSLSRTTLTADVLGDRFASELALVLRDLERRLGPVVQQASEGNRTAIIKGANANRARNEIRKALTSAGYDQLAETAYGARLDRLVERVLETRRLAQQTAKLSGAFAQRLEALRLLAETNLLDEGDAIARALWQATVRGVFGGRPVDQILQDLADRIDASDAHLRTLYDTSVSIFGRQVELLQAGDDPETPFLYAGPADAKNRPFCRDHVGKAYTKQQIDKLDNGQLDNCFLTAGGFNCRHQWTEISKFSELMPYVDSGERIPEVVQQLADLERAA